MKIVKIIKEERRTARNNVTVLLRFIFSVLTAILRITFWFGFLSMILTLLPGVSHDFPILNMNNPVCKLRDIPIMRNQDQGLTELL